MKLFEMPQKPTAAGLAELKWVGYPMPNRYGSTINLQNEPEHEFFPLNGGMQFLFRSNTPEGLSLRQSHWFGGTDEGVFLVELDGSSFYAFQCGGERNFYAYLRPEIITQLEKELGVEARRQGDIFAVALPYSWEELNRNNLLFRGTALETTETKPKETDKGKPGGLFRTRHHLTGKQASVLLGNSSCTVAEGRIEAPDHSDLVLEGPHLLAQTRGLANPKNAD